MYRYIVKSLLAVSVVQSTTLLAHESASSAVQHAVEHQLQSQQGSAWLITAALLVAGLLCIAWYSGRKT